VEVVVNLTHIGGAVLRLVGVLFVYIVNFRFLIVGFRTRLRK
jgi:hypothetical protein